MALHGVFRLAISRLSSRFSADGVRTTRCTGRRCSPALVLCFALVAGAPLHSGCTGVITSGAEEDGDGSGGGGGDGPDNGGDDAPLVEPDPYEPAPEPLALPDAVIADLAGQIQGILGGAPYSYSVLVENRTSGQLIAEANPDRLLKPASNTKLYTTAAALELFGEDHGLSIRVYADEPIGADGVVDGDVYVILEHDFSLSSALYGGPSVPLERVVRALRQRGLDSVTGTMWVSGESVYEANSVGYLNVQTERSQTIVAMANAVTEGGLTLGEMAGSVALEPPAGATLLLDHSPLTVAVGSSHLNTASNNEFADMLIRHIGWRIEGESSATAGTRAMLEWLAGTSVPSDGVDFHDGSGLSHDNRVSARSTVGLFRFMEETPVGETWLRSLAIAGVRGTIGGRLGGDDTVGRVFAKTGTLRDTISLSGALDNRHDGQRYLFSILFNDVSDALGAGGSRARGVADDIVRVFAGNLRGSGPRPMAPRLRWVHGTGTAGVLDIAWDEVPGAEGYLVWLSDDGSVWRRAEARYVRTNRFLAGEVSAELPTFVRVSARGADGLESDPSAVYAGTASDEAAELLLVDGNDRWLSDPSSGNVLDANHDFVADLAASTGMRAVASVYHGEIDAGEIDLASYPAILWAAGEQSVTLGALRPAERAELDEFVASGGALVVSGAELVWALADQGSAEELAFSEDVLGAGFVSDDAGTYEVEGAPGTALAELPALSFFAPDGMDIAFPDVLAPVAGAQEVLRYVGGTGGAAAVATTGERRVLVTGFPIEAMPSPAARAALVDAALALLAPPTS